MGQIEIPAHIIIHEKVRVPHKFCVECEITIIKAPFIQLGKDSGLCYCNKCSRQKMETLIASLKFHIGEMSSMLETYFPKTAKNKSEDINIAKFVAMVVGYRGLTLPAGKVKADMFVGRPVEGASVASEPKVVYEDEGRTMVLSLPETLPKIYACENETGGLTFMLAEEY